MATGGTVSIGGGNAARPPQSGDWAAWLEEHHAEVRRVGHQVCRRNRIRRADEAEFVGSLFLKLIERDYGVLRRFRGGCAIVSFLHAVARHHFLDWRNAQWGKWRPSETARRKGKPAVQLERLTVRDGMALSEAIATLVSEGRWGLSPAALCSLHAQLPVRTYGHRQADLDFERQPAPNRADAAVERRDLRRSAARVGRALASALAALPAADRRLLQMRFEQGRSVAEIASATGADPKRLYRHFARLLQGIRVSLEARQLTGGDVQPLLGHPEVLPVHGRNPHGSVWL